MFAHDDSCPASANNHKTELLATTMYQTPCQVYFDWLSESISFSIQQVNKTREIIEYFEVIGRILRIEVRLAILFHERFLMRTLKLITLSILLTVSLAVSMVPYSPEFEVNPPVTVELLGGINKHAVDWVPRHGLKDCGAWNAFQYGKTSTLAMAFGEPVGLVPDMMDRKVVEEACLRFAIENSRQTGHEDCQPVLNSIKQLPSMSVVSIGFKLDGVPVFDSYLTLGLNIHGELFTLKARGYGGTITGGFSLSEKQVLQKAPVKFDARTSVEKVERIMFPQSAHKKDIILTCVYRIEFDTSDPMLSPVLYMDAETGEILASENRVCFLDQEGTTYGLYHPLYGSQDQDAGMFSYEWVEIVDQDTGFSNVDGDFIIEVDPDEEFLLVNSELRGRWVEVHEFVEDDAAYTFEIEPGDDLEVAWDDQNSSSDERNLYYHVNFIHDFWKGLDEEFDGLDYPILAMCGIGGEGFEEYADNAFSSPEGIFFGRGNRYDNFALYADVVYHEYGHSVTRVLYQGHNLPYQGEPGALNEAWSDYFPCSITDEPRMGEGGLLGNNNGMRNLDNNLFYPDDIVDEVHADARIVGAAMWHTREIIGREAADSLFHFSRYLHGNDFRSYFLDVLTTDDDDGDLTNGSPHYQTLHYQFARHGITIGEMPHFTISGVTLRDDDQEGVSGNDNGIWEPGETIGINLAVFRAGAPYPYEDEPLLVRIETACQDIELPQEEIESAGIEVGVFVDIPETLLLRINEDASLGFADLLITVSTESDTLSGEYPLRIPVGLPQLLLVKDGISAVDHSKYFHTALEEIGLVWADYSTSEPVRSITDFLPLFNQVIWFTGNARQGVFSDESIEVLADYLDRGGKVLVTGQCAVEAPGLEQFFRQYFGVESVIDSLHEYYVQGVEDDPVGRGYSLLLLGGDGARNQVRPSAVSAVESAIEIYHWAQANDRPAAGVRMENLDTGARTLLLSFGLEAVGGAGITNSMTEALNAILEWFNGPGEVQKNHQSPVEFQLGTPYPNPFNGRVSIPVKLANAGSLNLSVYNVSGSLVWAGTRRMDTGASTWSIDAENWGSGTYFIDVQSGELVQRLRVVLVK